jgi:streptogramin lyase
MFIPFQSDNKLGQVNFLGSQTASYNAGGDSMNAPFGIAVDNINGNVFFTANSVNKAGRVDSNSPATLQQSYNVGTSPTGICVDKNGDAWVANSGSYLPTLISKLDGAGSTVTSYKITTGTGPFGICCDDNGDIWVALENSDKVIRLRQENLNGVDNLNSANPSGISGTIDGINNIFVIPRNNLAIKSDDTLEVAIDKTYSSDLPTSYDDYTVITAGSPIAGQVKIENNQPSSGNSRITFFGGAAANCITTEFTNGQITYLQDAKISSCNGNTIQLIVNAAISQVDEKAHVDISGTEDTVVIIVTPAASTASPFNAEEFRAFFNNPSSESSWTLISGADTALISSITATGGNVTDILTSSIGPETVTFSSGADDESPDSDISVKFIAQAEISTGVGTGPRGVIADENNKLWIACPTNDTVSLITISTATVDWNAAGTEANWDGVSYGCPTPDGNCVFVNTNANAVMKLNVADGSEIWRKTTATHSFNQPSSVSLDRNQNLWVVNKGDHTLTKLNAAGDQLASFILDSFGNTPVAYGDFTGYIYEVILNDYTFPAGNVNPEIPIIRSPLTTQIQHSLTVPMIFEMGEDPENGTQQIQIARDTSSAFPVPTLHESWGSGANYDTTISWSYSIDWVPGQPTTSGSWAVLGSGDPGPSGITGVDGVLEGYYVKASVHLPTYGNYFFNAKAFDGTGYSDVTSGNVHYNVMDQLDIATIIPNTKGYDDVISNAKISGDNFTASTVIKVGGVILSSTYANINEIRVTLPGTLFVGSHDITAEDPAYLSDIIIDGFTVTTPTQEVKCQLISPIDFTVVSASETEIPLIWYSVASPQGGTAGFRIEIDTLSTFNSQGGINPLYRFATCSGMPNYVISNAAEYSTNYDPVFGTGTWIPAGEGTPGKSGIAGINGAPATVSCFNKVNIPMIPENTYYWRVREWTGEEEVGGQLLYNDWSDSKIFIIGTPSQLNFVLTDQQRMVKKNGRILQSYRKKLYL